VAGPGQRTDVGKGCIGGRELGIAVRGHRDAVEGLVVQRIGEWQCDRGCLIVSMVPSVRSTRHDAATDLRNIVVVLRRTAFYRVHPRESGVTIARVSSDGTSPYARGHVASEVEVHGEPSSCVAINELDIGHAAARIAG